MLELLDEVAPLVACWPSVDLSTRSVEVAAGFVEAAGDEDLAGAAVAAGGAGAWLMVMDLATICPT